MREDARTLAQRLALRRHGLWGARAERLLEDWTDHVREDAERRQAEGADPTTAQEAAWKALGDPEALAGAAARECLAATWLGRHFWLGAIFLPFFAWLVLVAAVFVVPPFWIGLHDLFFGHFHPAGMACWRTAFNWLPWLASVAWLAWIAARMPAGWKLFWGTTAVLTLCSTSLWMTVIPPGPDGLGGEINVSASGSMGFIAEAVGPRAMQRGRRGHSPTAEPAPWLQTALLLLGAATFHQLALRPDLLNKTSSRTRSDPAIPE